jgi:hypothetical protein
MLESTEVAYNVYKNSKEDYANVANKRHKMCFPKRVTYFPWVYFNTTYECFLKKKQGLPPMQAKMGDYENRTKDHHAFGYP